MSTEDDPELRDLIAKSLETNGVLGKMRAQLRASTFLAFEDPKITIPLNNSAVQEFAATERGKLVIQLVREFLSFFDMQFSLSVFDPESCWSSDQNTVNRKELAACLGLVPEGARPLLDILLDSKASDATFTTHPGNQKCEILAAGKGETVDVYDEDFQSSTASPEPKPMEEKQYSVEEEVDVSASDLLISQASNADNDTLDHTASCSSLGAEYAEKL